VSSEPAARPEPAARRPVCIAIAALGGQGGGVLADWLVAAAEQHGWIAQSTSVPGVAQRTGTTVYYVEVADGAGDAPPVMALMPTPGDVDLVIAAELMEAGRAILRGLVTPDRTTLVASSHRVYAIGEKSAMGDGIAEPKAVLDAARAESRRLICFDMNALANEHRTVISAVLLGAVAASGALPFPRALYEQAIKESDVAVQASLAGFDAGFVRALTAQPDLELPAPGAPPSTPVGKDLDDRIRQMFPAHLHGLLAEGVRRLLDFQDAAYARLYLERLERVLRRDGSLAGAGHECRLTGVVARHLALWMSFEDTIRIADLKTRRARFERVRAEVRAEPGQIMYVTEYMHPRFQEFCETLPAAVGAWLLRSRSAGRMLGPLFKRGRRVATARLGGFLLLYSLAGLRRYRPVTLRYRVEQARIEQWIENVIAAAGRDYALGIEIAECARLIKGYGDTHERGLKSFNTIMSAVQRNPQDAGLARLVRTLRSAALADEDGKALAQQLSAIRLDAGEPAPAA
jgi:indolepyruvate ferredoxin oxidoreductase beta subunit